MRTCLNCKHRYKRLNISKCYRCLDTQSFICWSSNILHILLVLVIELFLLSLLIASFLSILSSPYHENYMVCILYSLFGGIGVGLSLLGLAYLTERAERRRLE